MKPTSVFDAREWNSVYDGSGKRGQFALFRRSAEVARDACAALMRPKEHWLDLGSGTGQLAAALRMTGATVTGVDHDLAMLQTAGAGVVSRVEQLPIANGTVTGVVSVSVVGCLDNVDRYHAEVHRVLQPGGHTVFTCTNQASWLLKLNYLLAKPGGVRFERYGVADVRRSLDRAGFDIVSVRFYNCLLHAGPLTFPSTGIARWLERLQMERVARNFIVVAQKRTT